MAGASCVREADPLGGRSGGCGHSQAGVGNGDFRREGRGETVEVVGAGMSGIADGERDRKPVAGIAAARGISEYGSGGDATGAAWDGKVGGEGTWHASKGGMCTLSRERDVGGRIGKEMAAGVAKQWTVVTGDSGYVWAQTQGGYLEYGVWGKSLRLCRWDRPLGGSGMMRGEGGVRSAPPPRRVNGSNPRPELQRALSAWLEEKKGAGKRASRAYPTLPRTNDKTMRESGRAGEKKPGERERGGRRKRDAKSRCHAVSPSDPLLPRSYRILRQTQAARTLRRGCLGGG
ncbi:hypothetical protein C8F04DRAFT_1184498 [Mycena alexandri]|uniref:Uncharacterized protein n=1 Tax=Mycena alexandri TaxID=1745969 RepID=A0AAD6SWF5_9AGAR|nr:hypothetical protein C8F04DRAFT_1184498 [Mycena alexandri]